MLWRIQYQNSREESRHTLSYFSGNKAEQDVSVCLISVVAVQFMLLFFPVELFMPFSAAVWWWWYHNASFSFVTFMYMFSTLFFAKQLGCFFRIIHSSNNFLALLCFERYKVCCLWPSSVKYWVSLPLLTQTLAHCRIEGSLTAM